MKFGSRGGRLARVVLCLTPVCLGFQNCSGFSSGFAKSGISRKLAFTTQSADDISISGTALGSPITVTASQGFAGAIRSINYNGKEFVDDHDFGRLIQTALQYDNFGECDNPTEGGTINDRTSSSSQLLDYNTNNGVLYTKVNMANWLAPGQAYPNGCTSQNPQRVARNLTVLSNTILEKSVRLGFQGHSNVIQYKLTLHVPNHHNFISVEAPAGYVREEFSSIYHYDTGSDSIQPIPAGMENSDTPSVFATPDGQYAIAFISPDKGQGTNTWYCVTNVVNANTIHGGFGYQNGGDVFGDYSVTTMVVVGSLDEVSKTVVSLYHQFSNRGGAAATQTPVSSVNPPPKPKNGGQKQAQAAANAQAQAQAQAAANAQAQAAANAQAQAQAQAAADAQAQAQAQAAANAQAQAQAQAAANAQAQADAVAAAQAAADAQNAANAQAQAAADAQAAAAAAQAQAQAAANAAQAQGPHIVKVGVGWIVAYHSGKCIDLPGGDSTNGTDLQQWDCNPQGQDNQQWSFWADGNGYYMIRSKATGKCMDVTAQSSDNGRRIQEWGCFSPAHDNQLFSLVRQGDAYMIVGKQSGKCLDIVQDRVGNGVHLQQWDCSGGENQLFRTPISP